MAFKNDSPMKPIVPFPGETDGPGTYGDNPNLGPAQSGEPKFKFFEDIPDAPKNEFDSPFNALSGKLGDVPNLSIPGEVASPPFSIDSPMTPLKKL
jgi:hypothetical protein